MNHPFMIVQTGLSPARDSQFPFIEFYKNNHRILSCHKNVLPLDINQPPFNIEKRGNFTVKRDGLKKIAAFRGGRRKRSLHCKGGVCPKDFCIVNHFSSWPPTSIISECSLKVWNMKNHNIKYHNRKHSLNEVLTANLTMPC